MNTRDYPPNDERPRRAAVMPSLTDTRMSRRFVEALSQVWVRDSQLLGAEPTGGALLAHAAEASEFGSKDLERARMLYKRSSRHPDADARAFAGRRRLARNIDDLEDVAGAYEDEFRSKAPEAQRMLAGIGLLRILARSGRPVAELSELVDELHALAPRVPSDVVSLFRTAVEDVLVVAGKPGEALDMRRQRWSELRLLGEEVAETSVAPGALGMAIAAERLEEGDDVALDWYAVSLEARPSAEALRPLLRAAYDEADLPGAEALLSSAVDHIDDTSTRSRYQYELGMLRAWELEDRSGAFSVLGESMKAGTSSPVAAAAFLALARTSHGAIVADDLVDALGASLDAAAGGVERADLLTQMARRFEEELHMTDAALELAREALDEAPGYSPAVRLLGSIYTRKGAWGQLSELHERELRSEKHPHERLRLHERLAELYLTELHEPASAERHLRSALEVEPHLPAVRRLARLLGEQFRWEELFSHLLESAGRLEWVREQIYLLEQAGDVAESRLRDATRAIKVYRRLLELSPEHSGAIASLGRLLSQTERWGELLELNEYELQLAQKNRPMRVAILCRSAEIARRHLGDIHAAEGFFVRALEEQPTCDEALRGLGGILKSQERWDELVEMTERELANARTDEHRRRCLYQLGELYAVRIGDASRAIPHFSELARFVDSREQALVWLERLHEATGDEKALLQVLVQRYADARDNASRARIAFRVAERLEWVVGDTAEAFEYYIEALGDDLTAGPAMHGLDRLWKVEDIRSDARRDAITCVQGCADRGAEQLKRLAWTFLTERGSAELDAELVEASRIMLADTWPSDPVLAERAAWVHISRGDVSAAEHRRANAPIGPSESLMARWARLDRRDLDHIGTPHVAEEALISGLAWLERETSGVSRTFPGSHERELFQRLGRSEVTLGELQQVDSSETGLRLAIMASRALSDGEMLRECWLTLAGSLEPTIRAQRAWLDLVAEDGVTDEERKQWLRSADTLGGFETPMRDEIYAAFTSVSDLEGLAAALGRHLELAPPVSTEAAALSLRRGRCLEMLGRRDEAIEALRFSAIHAPADVTIALEKARLETLADRIEDARITLEDCLDGGCQGEGRIEILGRLADLHQMEGGRKDRALQALEDAYRLSGEQKEWGTRLASAHAGFGQPGRCVQILESVLPTPCQEDDIRHWQLLARVLGAQLERADEAESILWQLFESFPNRRSTLSGLEEYYRRYRGAREFADRLCELLAQDRVEVEPARAAELWMYAGEIQFSVLKRFGPAEEAFRNARRVGGDSPELRLREAKAISKQPGRVRDSAGLVIDALRDASGDHGLWADASVELESVYGELQDAARLRVAKQLRQALGANVEVGQEWVKRDPTREFEPPLVWKLLGSGEIDESALLVLQAAAPLAERVLSSIAPNKREYRGRRARGEDFSEFETFLETACSWLEVQAPRVIAGAAGRGAHMLDSSTVWLPEARIAGNDPLRARFWAGYVAGMVFSGLAAFSWIKGDATRELIGAVAHRALGHEHEASSFSDQVGGLLLAPSRRAAGAVLREHHEVLGRTELPAGEEARSLAYRAGLLMCGDLRIAVEEMLHAAGWEAELADPRTRTVVTSDEDIRSVLLYALSDSYYLARYESGLAQRPWLAE